MPRKSNKTAHVLNLIAGSENDTQQKQDPKDNEGGKGVSVISSSTSSTALADSIRKSLEAGLESSPSAKPAGKRGRPRKVPPEALPIAAKSTTKTAELDGETYKYICIMENIVGDNVVPYMVRFGNCTCSRCVADTIALALSNLPAKYVVAHADNISPLVDYYWKKYESQILAEIIKACIKVSSMPHHKPE